MSKYIDAFGAPSIFSKITYSTNYFWHNGVKEEAITRFPILYVIPAYYRNSQQIKQYQFIIYLSGVN